LKTKVSFNNVSMTFKRDGNEVNVLDQTSTSKTREGEFLCILGSVTGCGKVEPLPQYRGRIPAANQRRRQD